MNTNTKATITPAFFVEKLFLTSEHYNTKDMKEIASLMGLYYPSPLHDFENIINSIVVNLKHDEDMVRDLDYYDYLADELERLRNMGLVVTSCNDAQLILGNRFVQKVEEVLEMKERFSLDQSVYDLLAPSHEEFPKMLIMVSEFLLRTKISDYQHTHAYKSLTEHLEEFCSINPNPLFADEDYLQG